MSESPETPLSSRVELSFELRVGEGTLKANVEVPAGKTSLTQILPIIQDFDTAIVGKAAQEAAAAGHSISCRAGCGACCRQMVPLSIFEAEGLGEWFVTLPKARQRELEERFHRALVALGEAGVLQRLIEQDWMSDIEAGLQVSVDYFHAKVACPFLEDESCSIHAIRPLSCREYLVTSPPELCQDPSMNDVTGVLLPLKGSTALYRLGQQLEREGRGWFPLIFLLAWAKKGLRPGEYFSGTGQEVLRLFIDQLATLPPADEAEVLSAGFMQAT